ncbi:hypothetical protein VB774_04675 [Pseudanabaena galeata UHCC 0370]|uniref:Uncharacterized protein n=1 Tax=Pseudanabaena galeata UHCC 0370 TaxID=3110310 RepID=A0ABU5TGY1_9CYAN|nr:hypothetical protein [Pseudanabaena galeata]MEA5476908.1 hypothetical protein [Pseudanabaena galeata UHCC 0370]
MSAILIMKTILVFPVPAALETPKSFFESKPKACSQKTIFMTRIAIDSISLVRKILKRDIMAIADT